MKPGQESRTAVFVCMGRAAAHGTTSEPRFADPTALSLLPEGARRQVERFHAGEAPRSLRERFERRFLEERAHTMVVRTVAIDEAIRAVRSPQVVILGAGLDGRAWRMQELGDAVVFEVDHPDSQRQKRARAAALPQAAREVRFVPVDFARDVLGDALAAAGHDPHRPTTWVWEGVVMYLTPAEVEATLASIAARSAAGSRIVVAYHTPAWLLWVVRPLVRAVGEPLRSTYTVEAMRALLGRHGFRVVHDDDVRGLGARSTPDVARATRAITHLRIVTADRER